jgi:hypothetical protein
VWATLLNGDGDMGLNYKQALLRQYQERLFEGHTSRLCERFMRWYVKFDDPIEYMHFLFWGVYSDRAWKIATDYEKEVSVIKTETQNLLNSCHRMYYNYDCRLGSELCTAEAIAQAVIVINVWNRMNMFWMGYRKDNPEPDKPYPFATYHPHASLIGVLRFTMCFDRINWPLISDWPEFFMMMPLYCEDPQMNLYFPDYIKKPNFELYDEWYADKFHYTINDDVHKKGWGGIYREEMAEMSDDVVVKAAKMFNWGRGIAQAEVVRRYYIGSR